MTSRIATLQQSLPFFEWYGSSPHQERGGQPGVVDLLFGNPHDMPIPAYVEALQRHVVPQHPGWFAYMFDDEGATGTAADGLRRHTGMDWDADDIAMTNGGWGAIAVGIRALVEPGDEVIYYDPPWFFYDLLIRGAEATPVTLPARAAPLLARPGRPRRGHHPEDARGAAQHAAQPDAGAILDDAELDAVAEVLREASDRHGRPIYLLSRRGVPPDRARRAPRAEPRRALRAHARPVLVREAAARARPADRLPRAVAADPRRGAGGARARPSGSRSSSTATRGRTRCSSEPCRTSRTSCIDIPALERRRDRLVPALAELGLRADDAGGHVLRPGPQPDRGRQRVRRAARRGRRVRPAGLDDQPAGLVPDLAHGERRDDRGVDRAVRAPRGSRSGPTPADSPTRPRPRRGCASRRRPS